MLRDVAYRDHSINYPPVRPSHRLLALSQPRIFESLNADHREFMAYCYAVMTDL